MQKWNLSYTAYDPEQEGLREALCVLGNGYFATRGAGVESHADGTHYPGTYLAGGYNRLKTEISGQTIENEDLVNFPNWLPLNFRIGESNWFTLNDVEIRDYQQTLNIQNGILIRDIHFRDEAGRETHLRTRRVVCMHQPHLAAIEMEIQAGNWNADIEILSALDGRVENTGVERYRQLGSKHLEPIAAEPIGDDTIYLQVRTNQSRIYMAQAARTSLYLDGQNPDQVTIGDYAEKDYVAKRFKLSLRQKQTLRIEKVTAVYTSRDKAISECGLEARNTIQSRVCFDHLFQKHKLAWKHLWRRFNIQIETPEADSEISGIIHLHLFHLLQTISFHTMDWDTGVPPRGWHGEAYRGHILWDELFVFPTLNLQLPELTRALLLYRYRRLPAARAAAQRSGFKGAMFPWQSGSNGREESQKIHLNPQSGRWIPDNSRLQRHVNAAIGYNIWQYFEATEDIEFLSFYGAEMLLEIARFWASLASFDRDTGRYEINGIMGPDEFHEGYPEAETPGLNNNAYTNIMASWILARGLQVLEVIPEDRKQELEETLSITTEELRQWDQIRKKLKIPFHDDGVISQFEGYENLQELDWDKYRKKYGDIQRLDRILKSEGDSPNRYKISKQADVLMLFYLFSAEELRALFKELGYELSKETIHATINYYMKRTSHGSTLSRLVHSWVLSRSERERSWSLFCKALKSDVSDIQGGTTPEGIHLGAMAGTIDLLQRGYSGIEFRDNILRFNPCLPKEITLMRTEIRYRGHSLSININPQYLTIKSERGTVKPIRIAYCEQEFQLKEGEEQRIPFS
jgi:alpha,alpha-trehalase